MMESHLARGTIGMDETDRGPAMRCSIVDVFAERPLAGNQLAVVRDCAHLDSASMQAIAREMNFSETTFVLEEREGEARVRIFTPDRELPFAGHPTLGTSWVLGRDRGAYTLDLAARKRVPVTFEADGVVWMEPPAVDLGDPPSPPTGRPPSSASTNSISMTASRAGLPRWGRGSR